MGSPESKNEAIRLLSDISDKISLLISISKTQGHQAAGTLQQEQPGLDTVLEFARAKNFETEICEIWYHGAVGAGWKHLGQPIVSWQAVLTAYVKTCTRNDRRDDRPAPTSLMDQGTREELKRAAKVRAERKHIGVKMLEETC